jgi:hypothetical protein
VKSDMLVRVRVRESAAENGGLYGVGRLHSVDSHAVPVWRVIFGPPGGEWSALYRITDLVVLDAWDQEDAV